MNILKYRDYEGTVEVDMERRVCFGRILFIEDVVTYEGESPAKLDIEFKAAVDDYIDTCKNLNRQPQKPLKGAFNVRVPPVLHKAAVKRALFDDISLNELVVRALDSFLSDYSTVNHNVNMMLISPEESFKTFPSSASTEQS